MYNQTQQWDRCLLPRMFYKCEKTVRVCTLKAFTIDVKLIVSSLIVQAYIANSGATMCEFENL